MRAYQVVAYRHHVGSAGKVRDAMDRWLLLSLRRAGLLAVSRAGADSASTARRARFILGLG